ncbi:LppP/LprE family lipoprotein [Kitasatospora sp. NPDC059327]|uniref:LppP/LprE family lipoprotein n=1 Tax=Kitasatospora sp. NPDC059327 TaxID=3346803 RepID=UPI0036ABBC53
MSRWIPHLPRGSRGRRTVLALTVVVTVCALLGGYAWWSLERRGTLAVAVADLPQGAAADIAVRGPDGFERHLSASETFAVSPGRYVLDIRPVRGKESDLYPVLSEVAVKVAAGASVSADADYANEVPHTTKVLDATHLDLVSNASDENLIFASDTGQAHALTAGDVLVVGIGPKTPQGLIRKVTAVRQGDHGQLLVATTPATIRDAMPKGKIHAQHVALKPPQGAGQAASSTPAVTNAAFTVPSGTSPGPSAALAATGDDPLSIGGDPGNFTLNASLRKETMRPGMEAECQKAASLNPSSPLEQAAIGGAGPNLDFDIDWDPTGIHNARWALNMTQKSRLLLTVPPSIELMKCNLKFRDPPEPVPLGEFPLWAGGVPLVFVMKANVVGSLEASFAKLDVAIDARQEAKMTAGLDWSGSGLPRPIASFDNHFTLAKGPKATIEGTAKSGLHLEMDLYGIAGPFLDLTPGIKLATEGGGGQPDKVELKAGLYTSAGLGLAFWGRDDLSLEISDLFHIEEVLWSTPGANPAPPSTPAPTAAPTPTPTADPAAASPCPSDDILRAAIRKQMNPPGAPGTPSLGKPMCWNGWAAVTWGPQTSDFVTISVFKRDHDSLSPAATLVPAMGDDSDPGWLQDCKKLQNLHPPAAVTDFVGCPKQPQAGDFDAQAALQQIKQLGYSANATDMANLRGPLRAVRAGTADGDGSIQGVFFFYGNRYVGRDSEAIGGIVTIKNQDGQKVTLEYRKYRPSDPQCCPSGGTSTFQASWNGNQLIWNPPLPG